MSNNIAPLWTFLGFNILAAFLWDSVEGLTIISSFHYVLAIVVCFFLAFLMVHLQAGAIPKCPVCATRSWQKTSLGRQCVRCEFTDMENNVWEVPMRENS